MRVKRESDIFSLIPPLSEDLLVRDDGGLVLPAGGDLADTSDDPSEDPSTDPGDDYGDSGDDLLSAFSLPTPPFLISTTTVQGLATATTTVIIQSTSPTTVTKSQFSSATQPAKANTPTALAASSSTALPSNSHKDSMDMDDSNMGLSKTTEHLLIAAGSIAATLVIVFVVFLVYRIRKGHKLISIFGAKQKLQRSSKPSAPPPQRGGSWNSFQFFSMDAKGALDPSNSPKGDPSELPYILPNALVRQSTRATNRPLVTDGSTPGGNRSPQQLNKSPQELPEGKVDRPQNSGPSRQTSRRKAPSLQPSSPVLPIERSSREFFAESDASHQSIPTYLRDHELYSSPPKASRFSWTNSNAPKTPNESRFSIATSTSSVPRYRTVESWVGAQTGRIDPAKFQDHLRREYEASNREPVPEVPSLPPPKSPSRRSKLVKHRPHMSDASVFRVHPGTRIDIPRTSLIPSEILDSRIQAHAL